MADLDPSPPLDAGRIEMIRSLDTKGDSLLGQLVEVFSIEAAKTMGALRHADERGDRTELHQCAHRLRGSAANMGAPTLASACAALERKAVDDSATETALSPLVTEIDHELERAIAAFRLEVGRAG